MNDDFSPYSILVARRLDEAGKGDYPDEFDPPCNAESSTNLWVIIAFGEEKYGKTVKVDVL
jgi:hypothetical protein